MPDPRTFELSLTGAASHRVEVPAGQGILSIGPVVAGSRRPDAIVGVDERLDWSTFDAFTTPSGIPWPRMFRYHGNDTGFLQWSHRRPVEQFHWIPAAPMTVDAGSARVDYLYLTLRDDVVEIRLPKTVTSLTVSGNLSLLRTVLPDDASFPSLYFYPTTLPSPSAEPLALPKLDALAGATSVHIGAEPLRQPLDCASLLQFPGISKLGLFGQLSNVHAVAELTHLRDLQLGDCPDLTGLPPLTTWPNLHDLHASNIDQHAGTELRRQLKSRPLQKASVTRLRTREWFEDNHGLPFRQWPTANARKATKAFRYAERDPDPEAAIRTFVQVINSLPGIQTIEREDAGDAVAQLAAKAGIDEDLAQSWFDAERDF